MVGKPLCRMSQALKTTSLTCKHHIEDKEMNPTPKGGIVAHLRPTQAAINRAIMVAKMRMTFPKNNRTGTNKTSNIIVCKTIYATLKFNSKRRPLLHHTLLQIINL